MPVVPVPDWTEFPKLQRNKQFKALATRAAELKKQEVALEAARRELNDEMEAALISGGVKQNTSIAFNDVMLAVRHMPGGMKLDEDKLVQAGVKRSIIDKCKVQGKPRHYVEVRLRKEQSDEQGGER